MPSTHGRINLTNKRIDNEKPPTPGKRKTLWDAQVPSLGLRVTDSGSKTFVVMRRISGSKTPRRWKVGSYPGITLAKARDTAREWVGLIDAGVDPYAHRDRQRDEEERRRADSVRALFEAFERDHLSQLRSGQEVSNTLRRDVVSRWGGRPVGEITLRDVNDLLDHVAREHGGYAANRRLAAIKRMFKFAVSRGWMEGNPAAAAEKRAKEVARDRVLSDDELRALWEASEALGHPFGPLVKVLLLTAQRRSEVAAMRWLDIDLDSRTWKVPRELTKSDRLNIVSLSATVMEILEALPRFDSQWVFTTTQRSQVSGFSKAKSRLDGAMLAMMRKHAEEAELAPWRLHDMRRTAASNMARLRVPPQVLAAVLNHSPGSVQGITAIYNRHSYEAEKRDALDHWAADLQRIVRPGMGDDNVIALPPRS